MMFYLFFPLFMCFNKGPLFYLSCGFAIYLFNLAAVRPLYEAIFSDHGHVDQLGEFLYFQFFSQAPIFLIGMSLFQFLKQPLLRLGWTAIVAAAWLAAAFALKFVAHLYSAPFFWLAIFVLACAVWCVVRLNISLSPISRLGELSYSVYLSHFAVISCVKILFDRLSLDRMTHSSFWMALVLVGLLCSIIGIVLRHLVEIPSSNMGRSLIKMIEQRADAALVTDDLRLPFSATSDHCHSMPDRDRA
jgi:peptidoglycan/LPS O-acetylase OafA/YrhL